MATATYTKNIRRVLENATVGEWEQGSKWYENARAFCVTTALKKSPSIFHEIPIERVIGALAALSPSCPWERNQNDLLGLLRGNPDYKCSTYGINVIKAKRILEGDLSALSGNKVVAFAECISNPWFSRAVCVDTHAYSIAIGKRITSEQMPNLGRARYDAVAGAYRQVADTCDLLPHQVQAITWLAWKREHNIY